MNTATRVGFACVWDPDPEPTWSYTPWNLRGALAQLTTVVDTGVHLSRVQRRAWQLRSLRRRQGRWVTPFQYSQAWERYVERRVQREVRAAGCDVVLQIQDLGILDRPYFTYQDLTVDAVLDMYERDPRTTLHFFPHLDRDALLRRRERQHQVYAGATGVLAMSRWLADTFVTLTGLPRSRVHVVHPGVTTDVVSVRPRVPPRRRLLFVGTSFMTKGGDVVLAACERLRAEYDPTLRLTIAGPPRWPLATPVPDGVDYVGRVPVAALPALYDSHDLFVMPSRMEGFGKVFIEALAHGLPCIGRNAYAMPELISPGRNGALVGSDDPDELASAIASVLDDDQIYEETARAAPDVAATYTWERAARDALAAMSAAVERS